MKKKVVVLFGSNTYEHLISCKSAKSILENIDYNKYEVIPVGISYDNVWYKYLDDHKFIEEWFNHKKEKIDNIIEFLINIDIVFPIIHGANGEDGRLQGLFELFDIKYVGCNTLTNALCFDKEYTKIICSKYGVESPPYIVFKRNDSLRKIELDFEYPVIVKPSECGSSIGINVANNKKELNKYIKYALKYDDKIIIEKFIKAKELECAVYIEKDNVHISSIGEIKYDSTFYDYEAKYVNDSELFIPSNIDEKIQKRIKENVDKIVSALNIKQISRIDFLYDELNDKIYLLEVNTMPGFTTISMYPKLLEYDKINYKKLISGLIDDNL